MDEAQNNKIKSAILLLLGLIFAIYFMMIMGCSTEKRINYHLKQSNRHHKKAVSLGHIPLVDTVFANIPIFIKETRHDTTFIEKAGDTVTIEKDRLKIKYVRLMDSVYIEGVCEADTIIKQVPYMVQEKIFIEKSFFDYLGITAWWHWLLFWIFLILVVAIFLWRLIK